MAHLEGKLRSFMENEDGRENKSYRPSGAIKKAFKLGMKDGREDIRKMALKKKCK